MPPIRREFSLLFRLSAPVVLAQVGSMLIGLVDTRMVGLLGTRELAAVALADTWLFATLILGIGLVMGIDPIVSQAHGAGRGAECGLALQRGIVVGLVATLPLSVLWWFTGTFLSLTGQDPGLLPLAVDYAQSQIFSIAPFLVFTALRQYLQGRGHMTPALVVIVAANGVNILLNWVLIFGHWGFDPMGVRGAALATGITRIFIAVALVALTLRRGLLVDAWKPWSRESFARRGLARVGRYGSAISIQLGLEVWGFSACTLFAGKLAGAAVASHIIVLKVASFAFMVPLGISQAAATRVGHLLGAERRADAQRSAWVALGMGGGAMGLSACAFTLFGAALAGVFSADAAVVALAASVFPIAGAFQLFDGLQAVGGGILRGMGTPRPAAIFNLVGYYVFALPLAYGLAFGLDYGLGGIWWGLCAGLGVVASLLVGFILRWGPATVARLAIET